MASELANYACDECKIRKIKCSRKEPECNQCATNSRSCAYSRHGIIRRNRRKKRDRSSDAASVNDGGSRDLLNSHKRDRNGDDGDVGSDDVDAAEDISATGSRMRSTSNSTSPRPGKRRAGGSLNQLSSGQRERPVRKGVEKLLVQQKQTLPERSQKAGLEILASSCPCPSLRLLTATNPLRPDTAEEFWQDSDFIDMAERMRSRGTPLFTFEQEAAAFTEMFTSHLKLAGFLYQHVPDHVLTKLATDPELINQKAYLIMFYGILLTEVSCDQSYGEATKTKLRWNLWICLNDARLLLEPSELNISALILLVAHIQDFHTPSFCWMMTSTACRMLQALGTNRARDPESARHRRNMFWLLNGLDKSLALIFGRPPTFPSRASRKCVPLPSVAELTGFQPHISHSGSAATAAKSQPTSLFGAHFMHQIFALSEIIGQMYWCIWELESADETIIAGVRGELDDWYASTKKVLEASYLVEEPLLDEAARQSLQLGIRHVEFQYLWLTVLLTRGNLSKCLPNTSGCESVTRISDDCVQASRRCLEMLDGLVSDSRDVYNGVVWQLLFVPFSAFFALLDYIRILVYAKESGPPGPEAEPAKLTAAMKNALESMECLPRFLDKMTARHPLAEKLLGVAGEHLSLARRLVTEATSTSSRAAALRNASAVREALALAPTPTPTSTPNPNPTTTPRATLASASASAASPSTLQTPQMSAAMAPGADAETELAKVPAPLRYQAHLLESDLNINFDFGSFDWFEWDDTQNQPGYGTMPMPTPRGLF